MSKQGTVLVVIVSLTVCACASAEVVGVRSCDFFRLIPCPRVSGPVQVDGRLDEWDLSRAPIVLNEESLRTWGGYEPPVEGDKDASARATLAWDESGLYFAADVIDDAVSGLPEDPGARMMAMWHYDGFMLMFYPTPALLADRSRYLDTPDDIDRMRQWGLNYHAPGARGRRHREQIEYVTRKTPHGYAVEALLPWKALGFAPRMGDRYRLFIIMPDSDDDQGARSMNWGQLVWASAPEATHYPERYAADVRLLDEANVGAEVVPARTEVAADELVEFQVIADALAEGWSARRAFARDEDGREVWAEAIERLLPANKRTTLSVRIPPNTFSQNARLTLGAVLGGADGKEVTASVPVNIVSSPAVKSSPTASAWPTIAPSADPSRYALPDARRTYSRKQWPAITREDYYKLACSLSQEDWRLPKKPPEEVAAEPEPWRFVYAIYALARHVHDKDPEMLALSKAMMHSTYLFEKRVAGTNEAGGVVSCPDVWRWWFYCKDHDLLTAEDEAWLREMVLLNARRFLDVHGGFEKREKGAQNRAFAWAMTLQGALYANPDTPEASLWKPYIQEVWDEWWPYRDTDENTDGYSAGVVGWVLPTWGRLMGIDVYHDKGWQELAGRWLHEVASCGARPSYGDGNTFNGSAMPNLYLFEHLASVTRDGRYKWAAHRLFEYATENTRDWKTWHLVQDGTASHLFWAYLFADDSIAEVVPESGCIVTTRKNAVPVPTAERAAQRRWFYLTDEVIPNKLVLRSGMGRLDMWAMVQLCPFLGHSYPVAPNITCLMSNYSALLTDQAYMDRAPAFHNVVTVEDLEGLTATGAQEKIGVPDLGETGMAAYACVDIDLYRGWPVRHRRQIVFLKNQLMWVKDDVIFHQGFLCKVGPRWHTRQVFPKAGENWANTFIDFHLSTGLGLGRGLHRTENPYYDLLIWFMPQKGCRLTHMDRSRTNIWQTLPQQLHYVWEGLSVPGQKLSFGTVLWPHKPDSDPGKWADNLEALANSPDVSAIRAKVTDELAYVMVINDTGQTQTAGPVSTDARACVVMERNGRPDHVMVYNGTTASYEDRPLIQLESPGTTQRKVE